MQWVVVQGNFGVNIALGNFTGDWMAASALLKSLPILQKDVEVGALSSQEKVTVTQTNVTVVNLTHAFCHDIDYTKPTVVYSGLRRIHRRPSELFSLLFYTTQSERHMIGMLHITG